LLVGAASCGESPTGPRVAAVVLARDTATLNALGDTVVLTATARDRNGNVVSDATIAWSSLDVAQAEVIAPGTVVSRAAGTTRIVARSGGASDTASVVVRQVPASISLTPASHTLPAGQVLQLILLARDSNDVAVANPATAWTSSDPEAVDVTPDGRALGKKARPATVTVTVADLSATSAITVVAGPPRTLAKVAGDDQTGLAGAELVAPISVRVSDAYDNAVAGVAIEWTTGAGSGSVGSEPSTTDAVGIASTRWTLGPTKGTDTLRASSGSLAGSPAVFLAMATPNGRIVGEVTTASGVLVTRTVSPALKRPRQADAGAGGQAGHGAGTTTAKDALVRMNGGAEAARATRAGPTARPVPRALIVRFRPEAVGVPDVQATALRQAARAREVARAMRARLDVSARNAPFAVDGTSPAILTARVKVDPEQTAAVKAELLTNPAVLAVEPEAFAFALESERRPRALVVPVTPNDPLYHPQAWHYSAIDAPEAWSRTTGSAGVLVAVVDDGIRFDHPAISGNLTSDGYDFVSSRATDVCGVTRDAAGDGNGYDPDPTNPADYDCRTGGLSQLGAHGLHVAGTVGAPGNDAIGTSGVNWSVRIRPVRVLGVGGSGTHYDIAQGILYAAGLPADNGSGGQVQAPSGARIINLSLGGSSESPTLRDAVRAAAAAGTLVIAAAGNTGDSSPHYPAAYPEVLSVAAVGPDLSLASYSSYGPAVDIAAPGGDFADGGASFGVASTVWNYATSQPGYAYYNGTSMAAPHVAGVAALVLAAEPSLTADELRQRLTSYALDLGPTGRDDSYGAGLVNARNAVTRSNGPARTLYAVLYDAQSGARLRSVRVAADATYAFLALDDAAYLVFAGEDEDGDGAPGVPGRRWGAFGAGPSRPAELVVAGAGSYPAAISIGWPSENEPNDVLSGAGRLMDNGYLTGEITTPSDADFFTITLPAGPYVFETFAPDGACGYALGADTSLELLRADGSRVDASDDVSTRDYCSRVTSSLPAGVYYLKVTGEAPGRYHVAARRSG
jgi:subtilisin family serine protease